MPLPEIQINWHLLGRTWWSGIILHKFQVDEGEQGLWSKILKVWTRWKGKLTAELAQNQLSVWLWGLGTHDHLRPGNRLLLEAVVLSDLKWWWHYEKSHLNIKTRHGWILVLPGTLRARRGHVMVSWCGHKRWQSGPAMLKASSHYVSWSSHSSLHSFQHGGDWGS